MSRKFKDLLAEARRVKGVSLRAVERATGISNAYLSQMESGAVAEPSPKKLHALAEYYGLSYGTLMNACGYALPAERTDGAVDANPSFLGESLTEAERAAVAAFLHELRRRSPKPKKP